MSAIGVMGRRTLAGRLQAPVTGFALAGFLAGSAARLVAAFQAGGGEPLAVIWMQAAFPLMPIFVALVTMSLWTSSRADGRLDLLLTAPVLERDLMLGKFLGASLVSVLALLLWLAVPLVLVPFGAPAFTPKPELVAFLPALVVMLLQAALWNAVGVWASIRCRAAAAAAALVVALALALPAAVRWGVENWCPAARTCLPVDVLRTQAYDFATGLLSLEALAIPLVFAGAFLFAGTKELLLARLCGRGHRGLRASTRTVIGLGFVFATLLSVCLARWNVALDLTAWNRSEESLTVRTRQVLAELDGVTEVTCFLSRRTPRHARALRLLRGLAVALEDLGGGRSLVIRNVDPLLDLAAAVRLLREGCPEGSLVFRRGRRVEIVPAATADEPACAAALLRLAHPARMGTVYWTTGHGEADLDSADPAYGMSDLARDLRREGYRLASLDVSAAPSLPADCRLLVVAGARTAFSHDELRRVEGYLRHNGRLLVFTAPDASAGVNGLLRKWGLEVRPFTVVSPRTVTGNDLAVTDLADHTVTRPLRGTTLLFGEAAPLVCREEAKERIRFTPLAVTDAQAWGEADIRNRPWTFDPDSEPSGPLVLAAALERGTGLDARLAYRPARIAVVGDAAFALNGALTARANANHAFLLNVFAWLSGLDASFGDDTPRKTLDTGLDRTGTVRLAAGLCAGWPLLILLIVALPRWFRRHRTGGAR